jgi:glutathione peroxidase
VLYSALGLRILAFPCNQFWQQEPGSRSEIQAVADSYGVTFTMFDKVDVKGSGAHPLYAALRSITQKEPDWNFAKYLVSRDGGTVSFFEAGVEPVTLQPLIQQLLLE